MIFRNAGVPPALFPGKPLVHLEAVVVPVGAPLIVQSLPYRREPCFRGEVLPYRREPPDLSGGAGLQSGEKMLPLWRGL